MHADDRLDITEHPRYWARLAEEDQRNNPDLVAQYRHLEALMRRYAEIKAGRAQLEVLP